MFQGKNVLVTGASRGIGKGIAEEFAKNGANVFFTYVSNESIANEFLSSLSKKYQEQNFSAIKCDIANKEDVQSLIEKHVESLESIDVLVNNAGITDDGLAVMMEDSQWDNVIQTNLNGSFYLSRKVAYKMLLQRHGNIINISSVAGVYGNAGQCNYAASKAGLIGMSTSMSKELASRNIRVNAIAPGFIETDMTNKMTEEERNKMLKNIGLKRFGKVDDVANLTIFLASDKGGYITGQTLIVDGGLII